MKRCTRRFLIWLLFSALAASLASYAQDEGESIFTVHVVQRGENLFRIALQYNLFAEQVATANGITDSNSIIVGQRLIIPLANLSSGQRLTHTVSAGETLASIAAAYGQTEADLLARNNLAFGGSHLCRPASGDHPRRGASGSNSDSNARGARRA